MGPMMTKKQTAVAALVSGLSMALLVACGGGGGGAASPSATGALNLSVTDGPGDDYSHVWVTITKIAFHTDPNATWSAADSSWQTYTLPSPVTLDLAALNNGALNRVFAGLSLPTATYQQIRIFLAGFDATLSSSAQSINDNESTPVALQWNDQVEYSDASGVHESPLEIAYPTQGIQLNGTFAITANSTLNLAVDFDLEHDVVKFLHGSTYNFTLKPNLRYFDLDHAGAITGQLATSALCPTLYSAVTNNSNCAYNLVVKAEVLAADGSRHYDTRATSVKADGSFALYPLPAGNYDILIRGRNMQTALVTGVPVTAGSTVASGATQVSTLASPITPVVAHNNEYFANYATPMAPTSGWAVFQQTLSNGGKPYEVRWGNTNPYTGKLETPMALQLGSVNVASYSAVPPLSFSAFTPVEGSGAYAVGSNGLAYYTLGANATLAAATAGSLATFTENNPSLSSGIAAGSVSGTISTTPSVYDKASLVFSRFANIVETVDVSSQVATGSGAFSVGLPAGTVSTPVPGAYYYAYLRVWNSAHPNASLKVVPFNGYADLRNSGTVTGFNISF